VLLVKPVVGVLGHLVSPRFDALIYVSTGEMFPFTSSTLCTVFPGVALYEKEKAVDRSPR
jgi:hypothetical protein